MARASPTASPDLIGSQKDYFSVFGVAIEHSDVFAVVVTVPLLVALLWFVGLHAATARRCAPPRRTPTPRG